MEISFNRIVKFLGRNGLFKSKGISVTYSDFDNVVIIKPITTKEQIGRSKIEIPKENIPELINILKSIQ